MGTPKKMLTAQDFLDAVGKKTEDYYIEALGGWVKLRPLSVEETDEARNAAKGDDGEVDPQKLGELLLPKALVEPQIDQDILKKTYIAAYVELVEKITDICGLSEKVAEAAAKSFRP